MVFKQLKNSNKKTAIIKSQVLLFEKCNASYAESKIFMKCIYIKDNVMRYNKNYQRKANQYMMVGNARITIFITSINHIIKKSCSKVLQGHRHRGSIEMFF